MHFAAAFPPCIVILEFVGRHALIFLGHGRRANRDIRVNNLVKKYQQYTQDTIVHLLTRRAIVCSIRVSSSFLPSMALLHCISFIVHTL